MAGGERVEIIENLTMKSMSAQFFSAEGKKNRVWIERFNLTKISPYTSTFEILHKDHFNKRLNIFFMNIPLLPELVHKYISHVVVIIR